MAELDPMLNGSWETSFVTLEREVSLGTEIDAIAWSPTEDLIATGGTDGFIRLVDPNTGDTVELGDHQGPVRGLAWSPDGLQLASVGGHGDIVLWSPRARTGHSKLPASASQLFCVAFAPDRHSAKGSWHASGSGESLLASDEDGLVFEWAMPSRRPRRGRMPQVGFISCIAYSPASDRVAVGGASDGVLWSLRSESDRDLRLLGHMGEINSVAFSPDGARVVTGSSDASMIVWDATSGDRLSVLMRHSTPVRAIAFSRDGKLLASKSTGGRVLLSRTEDWQALDSVLESSTTLFASIAFGPDYRLATYGTRQRSVRLWRIDPRLLGVGRVRATRYRNAKVVLLGDSGVGKSALAAALMRRDFAPTESTHGRKVYDLETSSVEVEPGVDEVREVLLWDLAGQPGYRLVHQLHLHDATVAAIVFDSRSDTDPFAGVRYWDRALRQAQRLLGTHAPSIKKLLVAARTDRGGVSVGKDQVRSLLEELGIEHCIATSAKTGAGIAELMQAVLGAIAWETLPKIESSKLLGETAGLIASRSELGDRLTTLETLWKAVRDRLQDFSATAEEKAQFEACVTRLESHGVVRQLTFGGYVLLKPELLDGYASAIVEAAREEPDGLGSIAEDDVRAARFRIPEEARLGDAAIEQILLLGTIEVLLRSEIALREHTGDGTMLVFPAHSTRAEATATAQVPAAVRIAFEGSAASIYTTLAVRLCRSGVFTRTALWKDGLQLCDAAGAACGVRLRRRSDEVGGEIEVFCLPEASELTRHQLSQFVEAHVVRRCVPNTLKVVRGCVCGSCGETLPDRIVELRVAKGYRVLRCPVCDTENDLPRAEEHSAIAPEIRAMDRNADRARDGASAATTLDGKRVVAEWDTFLCYNQRDRKEVALIGEALKTSGIRPWFDVWDLRPGDRWMKVIERDLPNIRSACVFVGGEGLGPWQDHEVEALLHDFERRQRVIVPVVLRSAMAEPELPLFLQGRVRVDFRTEDDALERLRLGINTVRNSVSRRAARYSPFP